MATVLAANKQVGVYSNHITISPKRLSDSPVTVTETVWLAATVVVLHVTRAALALLVLLKQVAMSNPLLPLGKEEAPSSTT